MSNHTVAWPPAEDGGGVPEREGLRERKKRLLRQRLSDTATQMFLERGFDAVRVAEVAEACDVSEKTVFNYFPNKESLILDRWDSTITALRSGLTTPDIPPLQATLRILDDELDAMISWWSKQPDPTKARASVQRFVALIESTPSLRAYERQMLDEVTAVVAEVIAGRAGMDPADPEPHIAAIALLGLWQIHSQSLKEHMAGTLSPAAVRKAVTADVHGAASLLGQGLSAFGATPATRRKTRGGRPREAARPASV